MKTIGLIGGMSWESSLEYYRILNEETKLLAGETHSSKCIMTSFDFHVIKTLQHAGDWKTLTEMMNAEAEKLKNAGSDFIVICTNTMHIMAPAIESKVGLPVLHIADATGAAIKSKGLKQVLLLGTNFTMESDFYRDVLLRLHGIEVVIPDYEDRMIIHNIIYDELVLGKINEASRNQYIAIIEKHAANGAEGVVLGCTEIPLLIKQEHVSIPIFDTTTIHAKAAVKYALSR